MIYGRRQPFNIRCFNNTREGGETLAQQRGTKRSPISHLQILGFTCLFFSLHQLYNDVYVDMRADKSCDNVSKDTDTHQEKCLSENQVSFESLSVFSLCVPQLCS